MKKILLLLALACGLAQAAPLQRDLGQDLVYHRVHQLPADLPTGESARKQPSVLDLRYVHGDADAATALAGWLRFHATVRTPVFVLANGETSAELLAVITGRRAAPGAVVVIGAATPEFTPDVAVKISDEAERQAYDALEHGVLIESLLNDSPEKPRNDEARLAREQKGDVATEDAAAADRPAKPAPPPAVIDAALQRAVHLHRTLLALKKL